MSEYSHLPSLCVFYGIGRVVSSFLSLRLLFQLLHRICSLLSLFLSHGFLFTLEFYEFLTSSLKCSSLSLPSFLCSSYDWVVVCTVWVRSVGGWLVCL